MTPSDLLSLILNPPRYEKDRKRQCGNLFSNGWRCTRTKEHADVCIHHWPICQRIRYVWYENDQRVTEFDFTTRQPKNNPCEPSSQP